MGQMFLQAVMGPGAELSYTLRLALAALTSWIVWFCLGQTFIKWLYECKIGQKIRMEECPLLGQLHEKKKETPTMGGALILLATCLSGLIWLDMTHVFTWTLLLSLVAMGSIGAIDDWLKLKWKNTKGLAPRKKMLLQTLVACFVVSVMSSNGFSLFTGGSGPQVIDFSTSKPVVHSLSTSMQLFFLPFFHQSFLVFGGILGGLCLFAFFWFVITGSSNAVNLTDGLDGLAAGLITIVCFSFAIVAAVSGSKELSESWKWIYVEGAHEIGVFLAALAGSCLGFLWYNCHPAQVFMGDTGSLGIGGVLGICAILMRQELFFAIASAVFVAETLSVILQVWSFRRYKKRIFLCSPLHHHFEYKGWAETKVVTRFWMAGVGFAFFALLSVFGGCL